MDENELVLIYTGGNIDADLLRNILEGSGIEAFLHHDNIGTIAPFYNAPGGVGAVRLMVPRRYLDMAEPIVKDFMENSDE